ncbi:Asp23/Gls24 family envelope stress response protein [Halobacillus litoralis]|uniref:Asp23/Gls24 family envelope stress response protein n=1 Tax=Halobacillus litoralis TaxID=45668 RepID=A0A845DNR2_9BACI|nr:MULTISPECIES: Asp23/Gls24 family envelope stress response protein [Halobacillus]MCA1023324.1 Asp23/Gls24 family envelope stress response protein [Halobacillus litoralis]MYL19140.1 Asp23/Gls24 family envelope stress response protein [Halobacillus litoralis]MYL28286.1 Asp23/Gls24 family envelope stress response protein [Halobacillus halophilus]MYL37782.1 Asp23/Gls24 family envelope stress response protein [Halobacillus litoralis]
MSVDLNNQYGHITISNEVISTIAGGAAVECYGIVGMASKNQLRDGLAEMLRKENFSRGVVVRQEEDRLHIDMYIIVSYGTKISEVAHNVQSQVKYTLNKTVGLSVDSVNIFIQGVRVTSE